MAKKDETSKTDPKSDPVEASPESLGSDIPPKAAEAPKRLIKDRIKDIEKRWGKEFTEVMADLHDHVFGTSQPHDAGEKKEG